MLKFLKSIIPDLADGKTLAKRKLVHDMTVIFFFAIIGVCVMCLCACSTTHKVTTQVHHERDDSLGAIQGNTSSVHTTNAQHQAANTQASNVSTSTATEQQHDTETITETTTTFTDSLGQTTTTTNRTINRNLNSWRNQSNASASSQNSNIHLADVTISDSAASSYKGHWETHREIDDSLSKEKEVTQISSPLTWWQKFKENIGGFVLSVFGVIIVVAAWQSRKK